MSRSLAVPPGFAVVTSGPRTLVADRRQLESLTEAGFDDPRRWEAWLAAGGEGEGRGAVAGRRLPSGLPVWVKKLRRGGLVAPVWAGRFLGRRRILDNLSVPLEARRRGVSTALPVALLHVEGPRGLFRAWLALEQILEARDLASLFRSGPPPTVRELGEVMGAVRGMHDAGIEHRDLNVGILLLRRRDAGRPEAWVIDLDAARLHARPLSLRLRRRSLRRLQRSFHKLLHRSGQPEWAGSAWWFESYAGEDAELRRDLERGGPLVDLVLAVHRAGWRRDPALRRRSDE